MNLHRLKRRITDMGDNARYADLRDPAVWVPSTGISHVEVGFRNLHREVISKIEQTDVVVGYVAWLTHAKVLDTLARTHGVSILVQKEEFLRPDLNAKDDWANRLRVQYDQLRPITVPVEGWYETPTDDDDEICPELGDPVDVKAVRCVGHCPSKKGPAIPRMHHKFLVFCHAPEDQEAWPVLYKPYAVWTGSLNLTANGEASLENALYIESTEVASAYHSEWEQLLEVSEDLDWSSQYAAPALQVNTGAIIS